MVLVVNRHSEAVIIEGSTLVRVAGEDGELEGGGDEGRRHGGGVEGVHGGSDGGEVGF